MAKKTEKQLALEWQKYTDSIKKATPIDSRDDDAAISDRKKRLEADPEAWIKYYFDKFSFAKPNAFHINSTARIIAAYDAMQVKGYGKFYQSRAWARGLSKSTRRMMEVFYLIFAKKFKGNTLLISKSEGNALRLLKPYRGQMEANQRIIQDYGRQQNIGEWETTHFTTVEGSTFLAVGAQMNPRGTKEDEMRVNMIIFDDVDDDEVCRNEERLDERWDWIETAVIPTVEISRPYFIFFDNNLIAEDSLAQRARKKANDKEIVNIRDANGNSSWPEKNNKEMIDLMLEDLSYESIQAEYYNNPMSQGKTFAEEKWGKCPPLNELPFVVCYSDPSSSNKDQPGQKSGNAQSRKATFVVGRKGNDYFIYKGFLDVMSSARFIESMYACRDFIDNKTTGYFYIENNTLQDSIYKQVYLPLIYHTGKDKVGGVLNISPDSRDKGNKWVRIEANLESPWRLGRIIFNIDEKEDPHMKRLVAQFKAAKPTSKQLDGPDCIEGAKFLLDEKLVTNDVGSCESVDRSRSDSKYY